MRPGVAGRVAFAVGCFGMAGCHKAPFSTIIIADLSWERGARHLAPGVGAACTVMVDNTAWDGSLSAREFWKQGDGFVWLPQEDPPLWAVSIPTGEAGADDSIQLGLSFKTTEQLSIVIVRGTVHARFLYAPPAHITVKMDPSHDLVSMAWGTSPIPNWWSGECLARLPFRHAPP